MKQVNEERQSVAQGLVNQVLVYEGADAYRLVAYLGMHEGHHLYEVVKLFKMSNGGSLKLWVDVPIDQVASRWNMTPLNDLDESSKAVLFRRAHRMHQIVGSALPYSYPFL